MRRGLRLATALVFLAFGRFEVAAAAGIAITVTYQNPTASSVGVAREFSDWKVLPLTKTETGQWSLTLSLTPGRYAYKFVVDGEWKQDPPNSESTPDGLGGANSVKVVAP